MKKIRIIPRLDIKGPNVIKGIHLEGLRIVGKPNELARKYYEQGADEIIYIDSVASLYSRDNLLNVVDNTTKEGVFIPLTAGGGIRTINDINAILRAGADKVAVNTAAVKNPMFIKEAAEKFGSQCIVLSVEALKVGSKKWEVTIENGREETGMDAIEWIKKAVKLGAGEVLITSVDKEGTKSGFELELVKQVSEAVSVPIIVSGGAGKAEDVKDCLKSSNVEAVAIASLFHYNITDIQSIKRYLHESNINVSLLENKEDLQEEKKPASGKVISIINYNLGNLKSVYEAFKYLGHKVKFVSEPEEIYGAEYLVLPGVGAFGDGMANLKKKNLDKVIKEYCKKDKPLLGICLGAQLFMSESEEFGTHKGLDLIPGKVVKFKDPAEVNPATAGEKTYRVPHIGWNMISKPEETNWSKTLFENIAEGTNFYFVHSYNIQPQNPEDSFANCTYGGQEFCAVVKKGNIIGCQFHPEKSGRQGLEILKEFCSIKQVKQVQQSTKQTSKKTA
ncbi:imidazole glycerol phosphate synthase subunit HisF [Candidatus Woesearchaeota archaeon]|nr:imidazole glycerol phosphate synthase subunit HisF [Candidatus Woesearchaeota archaeon]